MNYKVIYHPLLVSKVVKTMHFSASTLVSKNLIKPK